MTFKINKNRRRRRRIVIPKRKQEKVEKEEKVDKEEKVEFNMNFKSYTLVNLEKY